MTDPKLRDLIDAIRDGRVSPDDAMTQLRGFNDLGFARVDHQRASRCGFPEVIFAASKEPSHTAGIAVELLTRSDRLLITRANDATWDAVQTAIPDAIRHAEARAITCIRPAGSVLEETGLVAIVTAGTSDLPVAEEAAITARMWGARVETRIDIGVAGIHRLLAERELLEEARAIVVIAGMEGALASVVGGLVACPVIAVPTSVGYGASFDGLAPLLGMLNACAPNITVVNIDNGFGGGYVAGLINRGHT